MPAAGHFSDIETDPAALIDNDNDSSDDDFVSVNAEDAAVALSDRDVTDARPMSPTRSVSPGEPSPPPAVMEDPSVPSGSLRHSGTIGSVSHSRPQTQASRVSNSSRGNRLSGFFSNFKSRGVATPSERLPTARSSMSPGSAAKAPEELPPPALPAPSLRDLGLSLNVLTPSLSPSHFATPPSSGTFMKPHYLLLCHSQGLDVLPLVGPPAPSSYALVRRVPFKSVLVMEERGVLVAIAGRRDGVRVYALEEVRKAVEWRMEIEIQREREKARREESRSRASFSSLDIKGKSKAQKPGVYTVTLPTAELARAAPILRQRSMPTTRTTPPPRYSPMAPPAISVTRAPRPRSSTSNLSLTGRPSRDRGSSVSSVLQRRMLVGNGDDHGADEEKGDWIDAGDEEALVAAGPSGSAALDERTSAIPSSPAEASRSGLQSPEPEDDGEVEVEDAHFETHEDAGPSSSAAGLGRRNRPPNLHLEATPVTVRNDDSGTPMPISPAPTVFSLQRALSRAPPSPTVTRQNEPISLAQALFESRLPGTRPTPLITLRTQSHAVYDPTSEVDDPSPDPHSSTTPPPSAPNFTSSVTPAERHTRQRWSAMEGVRSSRPPFNPFDHPPTSDSAGPGSGMFNRSPLPSDRAPRSAPPVRTVRSTRSPSVPTTPIRSHALSRNVSNPDPPMLSSTQPRTPITPRRFLPKLLAAAFRNSHEKKQNSSTSESRPTNTEKAPPVPAVPLQTPAPKMEYVKLPGTKGSLMIKAVETPKKSFLAILCGDAGEKVELFAGTYRTALGLSRTFILPDSPRSLELQLQGDDLVELFLMFSQNVFGLEPATVRVREVRIGRAERRAARRRAAARENTAADLIALGDGTGEGRDGMGALGEEGATTVITTVVSVGNPPEPPSASTRPGSSTGDAPTRRSIADIARNASESRQDAATPTSRPSTSQTKPLPPTTEESSQKSAVSFGPYSTFQQLSFAPNFPLASIADEYIIPPTYLAFIDYQKEYERTNIENSLLNIESEPAPSVSSADVSVPQMPLRWLYQDPRGVLRGPWDAEVMQNWLRDGFLPPTLPVRREDETEFTNLQELRARSKDPESPFSTLPERGPERTSEAPPPRASTSSSRQPQIPIPEVLLPPTSLLLQPRRFGPPALFYSSRGGHSTTIVDSRGRSVLKGRVAWSPEIADDGSHVQLGDVKRLESFDIEGDRAVMVAFRQGGLEAVDLSDALLLPADHSRTSLPFFTPPTPSTSRRKNFVWRLGSPVEDLSMDLAPHGIASVRKTTLSKKSNPGGLSRRVGSSRRGDAPKEGDEAAVTAPEDDIIFLGRNQDRVYMCERNSDSFRILRLSPS